MDLTARKAAVRVELMGLKADVTPDDKSAAHLEYGVNVRTQERYLNGEVASLLIGNTLLMFYKKRISKRQVPDDIRA